MGDVGAEHLWREPSQSPSAKPLGWSRAALEGFPRWDKERDSGPTGASHG